MKPNPQNLKVYFLLTIGLWISMSKMSYAFSGQLSGKTLSEKVSNKPAAVYDMPDDTLSLFINATAYGKPISPYIFGEFIEHQGRCIYGGIWAEMIKDRKFYYPIDTLLFSDPNHKSPWRVFPLGTYAEMDTLHKFVGKHSPRLDVTAGLPRGISQDSISLQQGRSYTGHIVLSGTGSVVVRVSLVWGSEPGDRQTIEINSLSGIYEPIPLEFTAQANTDLGSLEIFGDGEGSFYVGTVSLMPADNIQGMRADVIDLLKKLGGTIYRWPGGWFGNGYDFHKAIGDRDKRTPIMNGIYGTQQIEPNDFGPDEFMTFVRTIDAEPYLGVCAGGPGDNQLAADEVEYFNGSSGSPMGQLRAANGHTDPYNVKFWGIGCETWGFEAIKSYAPLHNQIAQAMLAVDPKIKIVGVGGLGSQGAVHGQGEWTKGMLTQSADYMNLISEHLYAVPKGNLMDYSRSLADMVDTFVAAHRKFARELPSLQNKEIPLVFDEWNYFWGNKPYLYGDGGVRHYFRDALGMATALHELLRNSKNIFMANTHAVNVLGHIKTTNTAASFEVTALPLMLYRHHFGTLPFPISAFYDSLNVVAALTADRNYLTVGIVNPTAQNSTLKLDLKNAKLTNKGEWWRIMSADIMAFNEPGKPPEVVIDSGTQATVSPVLNVPPWSITLYKFPIQIIQNQQDTGIFTFVKTEQVTPDTHFKNAGFVRAGYVPATGNLAITFGGAFYEPINGFFGGYDYKEYNLNMEATGKYGRLYGPAGDIGGLIVGNDFYAANQDTLGWRLVKFNAVSWEKLVDIRFSFNMDTALSGDMMLAFVNGQIDVSSQCLLPGEVGPPQAGTGTHHNFFSKDLEFQERRILGDTPHITGSGMIYVDGVYYFISATAFTGDVIVMKYDSSWNYLGMKKLIDQAHWSEGVAFDGQRFYLSYLDTRWRDVPHFFPHVTNVHLAAFDSDWNLLQDVAVTDLIPADSLFTGRPSLLLHENRIYVSYDMVPVPEDLDSIEGYVGVYNVNPVLTSIKQNEVINNGFQLGQNYPNPSGSMTYIDFSVPSGGVTTLKVYDIQGREVAVLINEIEQPGKHTVIFNTLELPDGIYFYQLMAGGSMQTRKCLVIK